MLKIVDFLMRKEVEVKEETELLQRYPEPHTGESVLPSSLSFTASILINSCEMKSIGCCLLGVQGKYCFLSDEAEWKASNIILFEYLCINC